MLAILNIVAIVAVLAAHALMYVAYRQVRDRINITHEFAVHLAAGVPGPDCTRAIERLRRVHVRRLVVWLAAWWASFVFSYIMWLRGRHGDHYNWGFLASLTIVLALSGGVVVRAWTPHGVLPSWRLRWSSLRAVKSMQRVDLRHAWSSVRRRRPRPPHPLWLWQLTSGGQIVAEYKWPLKPGTAKASELFERLQGEIETVQEPILWSGLMPMVYIGEARRIVALARSALPTCMSLEDS